MLAAYDRALTRSPLLVKTVTSAALFGAGDLISQKFEGKETIQLDRLARMTAWGSIFAVVAHPWYTGLDKVVKATGVAGTVQKVLADQLIWTPPINCFFFWTTTMLEHGDSALGIQNIKDKLWPTLKVNWVVWPVLQAVNFSLIPGPYRILYINVCAMFWSAFLSNMANKSAPGAEAVAEGVKVKAEAEAAGAAKPKDETRA